MKNNTKKEKKVAPNIILTGMRGCGKSTLGEIIAANLGREFIDLDRYIERSVNKKIDQIVESHGWTHFRNLEEQAVSDIAQKNNLVISTGGGTLTNPKSAKLLKKNGFIILLTADIETLKKRIEFSKTRPPLTCHKSLKKELEQIWKERKSTYLKYADFVYDNSSDKDPEEKAEEIIEVIPAF
ncbi:MAG: shikimate kinase [Candidatus Gracilibacteria bacterium]|jgi:shikimate kinase